MPASKDSDFLFHLFGTSTITGSMKLENICRFPPIGKKEPLDLYENTGWKCQAPTPRTIKVIVSNLNWE